LFVHPATVGALARSCTFGNSSYDLVLRYCKF